MDFADICKTKDRNTMRGGKKNSKMFKKLKTWKYTRKSFCGLWTNGGSHIFSTICSGSPFGAPSTLPLWSLSDLAALCKAAPSTDQTTSNLKTISLPPTEHFPLSPQKKPAPAMWTPKLERSDRSTSGGTCTTTTQDTKALSSINMLHAAVRLFFFHDVANAEFLYRYTIPKTLWRWLWRACQCALVKYNRNVLVYRDVWTRDLSPSVSPLCWMDFSLY